MLYAIIGGDIPDSLAQRMTARPAHLKRIEELENSGRLILAGPFPAIDSPDPGPAGFRGSLIVAEFDSLSAAKTWADDDPYMLTGVFASVKVQPFRKVRPA